jgi:hypothetical protein
MLMADEPFDQEIAGSAIAAFTLSQMAFWVLVQQGLIPKAQAEQMLGQAVKVNNKGGRGNRLAATKLAAVLQNIQAYQPPSRQ